MQGNASIAGLKRIVAKANAEVTELRQEVGTQRLLLEEVELVGRAVATGELTMSLDEKWDRMYFTKTNPWAGLHESCFVHEEQSQLHIPVRALPDDGQSSGSELSESVPTETEHDDVSSVASHDSSVSSSTTELSDGEQPSAPPLTMPRQAAAAVPVPTIQSSDGEQPSAPPLTMPQQAAAAAPVPATQSSDGEQPSAPPVTTNQQAAAAAPVPATQSSDGEQPSAPPLTTPQQAAAAVPTQATQSGDGEQQSAPPLTTPRQTAGLAGRQPAQITPTQQPNHMEERMSAIATAAAVAVAEQAEPPGPSLLWRTAEVVAVCSLAVPIYTMAAGISAYNCISWAGLWRR